MNIGITDEKIAKWHIKFVHDQINNAESVILLPYRLAIAMVTDVHIIAIVAV